MSTRPFVSKTFISLSAIASAFIITSLSAGLSTQVAFATEENVLEVQPSHQNIIQVYPDQHFLVALDNLDDPTINRITLDASEIGAGNKIDIPLELMVVSISANQS